MTAIRDLTCRDAARLLFADDALSEDDRQTLEAHIAECEACERVQAQSGIMRLAEAAWRRYLERDDPAS